MIEHNAKVYKKEANIFYEASYWRRDEDYLVSKYFVGGKKLLVLGCGGGRTLLPLYKKGFKITAIDIVPEMVEAAKKKIAGLAIDIKIMDAAKLDFSDNSFDFVFFPFHGLDCVDNRNICIKEARRVLKNEGVFIFNSHNLFFPRSLKRFFLSDRKGFQIKVGEGSDYLWLYHTTFFEIFKLKKLFKKVKFNYRTALQSLSYKESNWKDKILYIFRFIDKSIYFICKK